MSQSRFSHKAEQCVQINLGPLLWHHEKSESTGSLELTLEDVKAVAGRMGFLFKVDLHRYRL